MIIGTELIGYIQIQHGKKLDNTVLWKVLPGQENGNDASSICNSIALSL